jgi:hypothetical protein
MLAAPVAAPALRVRGVLANAVTVLETKPVFDVILPLAVIYPIVSTPPELKITALAYPVPGLNLILPPLSICTLLAPLARLPMKFTAFTLPVKLALAPCKKPVKFALLEVILVVTLMLLTLAILPTTFNVENNVYFLLHCFNA